MPPRGSQNINIPCMKKSHCLCESIFKIVGLHENNPMLQDVPGSLASAHPSFQSGCILKQGSARFWHDNRMGNTFSPQKNAVPLGPLQHHLPSISYMKIYKPIRQKIRTDLKLQKWWYRQDTQKPIRSDRSTIFQIYFSEIRSRTIDVCV